MCIIIYRNAIHVVVCLFERHKLFERHVLASVLHMLIVAILTFTKLPALWMIHYIVPLYKRKSVYAAINYIGIHLTTTDKQTCLNCINCIIHDTTDIHWNVYPDSMCLYARKTCTRRSDIADAYVYKSIWQKKMK